MSGGPLAGLRVLDTATLYAGPFISTVLADHGADVIKIEPPGGDGYRHGAHRMWPLLARNKRSVVADLRSKDGADLVRTLAPDLDVVVVNMPARLLTENGLDYDSLRAINPGLIYVHVTAYGLDGPYGGRPGSGTLGEALAGLTHMTGAADGPPVLPSVALGDAITGYVGAFGVLAACYHRLAHGASGQLIDVNPVDAMLQMTGPVLTQHDDGAPPPSRMGSRLTGSLLRGVFRTSDDAWVAISASTPRHLREIAELCGPPDPTATWRRRWNSGCPAASAPRRSRSSPPDGCRSRRSPPHRTCSTTSTCWPATRCATSAPPSTDRSPAPRPRPG